MLGGTDICAYLFPFSFLLLRTAEADIFSYLLFACYTSCVGTSLAAQRTRETRNSRTIRQMSELRFGLLSHEPLTGPISHTHECRGAWTSAGVGYVH